MSDYFDAAAIGQTLLYSLVAVLAVVGSFSVGARTLNRAEGARAAARPATAQFSLAYLFFLVAAAGAGLGVWLILEK